MYYVGDIILSLVSIPISLWIEYGLGYLVGGYTGARVMIQIDMVWRIIYTLVIVLYVGQNSGGLYYATLISFLPAMIGWVIFFERIQRKQAEEKVKKEQAEIHAKLEKELLKKITGDIKI